MSNGIQKNFRETFLDTVWHSKRMIFSTVLVAILSYGFAVTNFSVGVDDYAAMHYLHSHGWGSMIQQGRLSHVVLEALTGTVTFLPFFNDFLGVVLFVLSAWVLCAVFQYVTGNAFSDWSLCAFSGIYLSYSIINEKFIYNLDVVVTMLSYLCFAMALLYSYQFVFEKRKNTWYWAVAALIVSISSYESFPFLYVSGVFFLFILKIAVNGETITLRDWIEKGLQFALILLAAIVVYYGAVFAVQFVTGQYGAFERHSTWRNAENLGKTFVKVLSRIVRAMSQTSYFPILIFNLASVLGIVIFSGIAVRKKSISCILSFAGLYFSNFILHFLEGSMLYRGAQGFCFFVAGVVLCLLHLFDQLSRHSGKQRMRKLAYAIAALLILLQAADLNSWFYHDYTRYKKEEFAIHSIATRLVAECDISKPVVFTNPDWNSYLFSNDGVNETNGTSMLMVGVNAFYQTQSQSMIAIFKMHGYDFLQMPTEEQAEMGKRSSADMEAWPAKGSIREFEDYIVVNFAEK